MRLILFAGLASLMGCGASGISPGDGPLADLSAAPDSMPMMDAAMNPGVDLSMADLAQPLDFAAPLLGRDDFMRAQQPGWGTALDGQLWGGSAQASPFFIINNNGRVDSGGIRGRAQIALIGPMANDAEVFFTGSANNFLSQEAIGAVARASSIYNYYRAAFDGTNLTIDKFIQPTTTPMQIASTPVAGTDNTSYSMRFRVIGTTLSAKVWDASGGEPAGWMLTTTDSTFATGQTGLEVYYGTTPASNVIGAFSYFESRKL